jgi:hypothetical protein
VALAPPEPSARARAALGLPGAPSDPIAWGPLRDALAALLAESPEERPRGLDEGLWRLIQRRVWQGRRAGAAGAAG